MTEDISSTSLAAQRNIDLIAEIEGDKRARRSLWHRISRIIVLNVATEAGFIVHFCIVATWIGWNLFSSMPFDPAPFALLELALTCEAIFLALFIIANQHSMQVEAGHRNHLDLQVELLIEAQTTKILEILHDRTKAGRTKAANRAVEDLIEETDVKAMHEAVVDTLKD